MAMQLLSLYRNLSRPNTELSASSFQVVAIPGYPHHRIGKDAAGAPALLVHIGREEGAVPGPVALQHISVQHRVRCSLLASEQSREEDFTVVRCVAGDRSLREYFVSIAEATLQQLGPSPTRGQVTRAVQRLTELFRAFELPSRKTAQGLWAELVVIAYASAPSAVVAAWHEDPDEAFDFADGRFRVESKSFGQATRTHMFTLRQARPGPAVNAVIVSIRAERSAGGTTIADLLATIRSRGLSADEIMKVQDVVAQSLGDAAPIALTLAFDLERARSSVLFFDSAQVPSVDPMLPPGVSNVRFEAILDEAAALTSGELGARNSFFAAFLPD